MSMIDQAKEIRKGEELDLDRLNTCLKEHISGLKGDIQLSQFAGGASNLTYLVRYDNREMVLRRPPFGSRVASAHDMGREFRVIKALDGFFPVPKVYAHVTDMDVLDCEFYVMERLSGIIPRKNLPRDLSLDQGTTRELCINVLDKLLELHRIDYQSIGLSDLGKGSGYVSRQVTGWSQRFSNACTDDVGDFTEVIRWLNEKQPADIATCLIHNDFRFDNVVLDPESPSRVIGVLDWEMCTLGDPLMDLGNTLAYWVQEDDDDFYQQFRRQPTNLPGMLSREQVISWYCDNAGLDNRNFDFYSVYGLFRLAGIIQQIYLRYRQGKTKDPRFSGFGLMANYLEKRCLGIIEKSKL